MARKPQFTRTKTTTVISAVALSIDRVTQQPIISDRKTVTLDFPVKFLDDEKVIKAVRRECGNKYQPESLVSMKETTYSMAWEDFYANATVVGEKDVVVEDSVAGKEGGEE